VVFFNYTTMQMTAKIVYYGPGLCGKTTNLQAIHQKTAPGSRGEMVSLETETDRTLFFDLLPLDVGVIGGMKVRLQLYTVPGQVFYNATRKLVLKGVDGVVFVADSQAAALDTNIESFNNLKTNLAELGLSVDQVPVVFQYNKRDIRNILTVAELNQALNPSGMPHFEAAALHSIGVFETLKAISRLALASIRKKIATENRPRATAPSPPAQPAAPPPAPQPAAAPAAPAAAPAAPAPPPAAAKPAPAAVATPPAPPERPAPPPPPPLAAPAPAPAAASSVAASSSADPLAALVEDVPAEEVSVEFAEEDTGKHAVRPVETKGGIYIQQELEKLRALAGVNKPAGGAGTKEIAKRLQDIMVPDAGARQEVKRKASLEIPAHLLKNASALRIHLGFDGAGGEDVKDALVVKLVGNRRLERLTLHLDLEIKAKS
jgi:mutual gliding-motility protein MglA